MAKRDSKKTLYLQVVEYIKNEILHNRLQPGDKLPTELELSKMFGVSRITSKRALDELAKANMIYRKKGQGSFVLPIKKGRIEESVPKVIAIVLPTDGTAGRRVEYVRGAMDYLDGKGYYLSVHTTYDDPAKEREYLVQLPQDGIKGIILYPSARANFDTLLTLYIKQYPIVLIDQKYESLPLSAVVSDNFDGAFQAVSHLIKLGHRRIAYVALVRLEDVSSVRERFLGYCKALRQHDIPFDRDVIRLPLSKYTQGDTKNKLKDVLSDLLNKGTTAIFAEHDYLAIMIAKELSNMGVSIPQDVSLVGFDNIEMLEHLEFQLTTIDQDFYQIGKTAAQLVLECIENGVYKSKEVVVPVKLIERDTTARRKAISEIVANFEE
ncbi:MAG: GntR family transcriptional regulator [Clostridiales bacterium]|jgi:DNA-binding LacI/PurR family transcriptional regulator|nr:GntR family transcriptional regulator [Clostridiales bacterium]